MMIVKNIDELINCMLNDYSNEERIEFHESFDKYKIYEQILPQEIGAPYKQSIWASATQNHYTFSFGYYIRTGLQWIFKWFC